MASEFMSLNDKDTKELRKQLGLPTTKDLRYFYRENVSWVEAKVINYEIVDTYQPSGTCSLMITLSNNDRVRILADYFSDMQKSTFLNDITGKNNNDVIVKKETVLEKNNNVQLRKNKVGKRIEAMPTSYVVLDLETTGVNHKTDEIIEIGAIKYNNGKEIERLSLLINPERELSEKIIKLTGITNEMLKCDGVDKNTAMFKLYSFLEDYIVIGHNIASFDSKFLEDAYLDCLKCNFCNDYVDTLFLARKEYPKLKHHRLEDLSELFNVDYSKAHRATEDCIINHLVYENMAFGKVLYETSYNEYLLENTETQVIIKDVEVEEMEEMLDEEYVGWKEQLHRIFEEIIEKRNLPPKSIDLKRNKKENSYSICIYEPDLVEDKRSVDRYTVIARVIEESWKTELDKLKIELRSLNDALVEDLPNDVQFNEKAKWVKISKDSDSLMSYLVKLVENALDNYTSKAGSFACCARYEECSDAKRCTHPNQLYSTACAYRKNLDSGKIFYGKNKNIEE